MERIFAIFLFLSLAACSDEPTKLSKGIAAIRIEAWRDLDRTVEEYRELHPDRPILVFYTAEWDAMGLVAQKYLREPRFFELFTRFRVLPLVADCTMKEGVAWSEFQRISQPEGTWIHCFFLSRPSDRDSWFPLGIVSSDVLYETLKSELAEQDGEAGS